MIVQTRPGCFINTDHIVNVHPGDEPGSLLVYFSDGRQISLGGKQAKALLYVLETVAEAT